MAKNPFKTLTKIYSDGVEDSNKLGFADYYKVAFSAFQNYVEHTTNFHIIRYEYLDGYFIFGTGTNSVVHFHINECPGWKFGIWFSGSSEKDEISGKVDVTITGEFFAQYEETIDKFKPTASAYSETFRVFISDINSRPEIVFAWKIESIIKFISKHPIRAWAADNYYYDYNTEYVSSIKLLYKYLKYRLQYFLKRVLTPILDKNMLAYTKHLFYPTIESNLKNDGWEVEMVDHTTYCIPRYEITIRVPNDSTQETGCFGMFEDDEVGEQLQKKFNRRYRLLEKISDLCNFYWSRPIDSFIIFWKASEVMADNNE